MRLVAPLPLFPRLPSHVREGGSRGGRSESFGQDLVCRAGNSPPEILPGRERRTRDVYVLTLNQVAMALYVCCEFLN